MVNQKRASEITNLRNTSRLQQEIRELERWRNEEQVNLYFFLSLENYYQQKQFLKPVLSDLDTLCHPGILTERERDTYTERDT
jgi:hypothetical protein